MSLLPIIIIIIETGFCCVAQVGLTFLATLRQPPEDWDYKHAPPQQACPFFFSILFLLAENTKRGSLPLKGNRKGRALVHDWVPFALGWTFRLLHPPGSWSRRSVRLSGSHLQLDGPAQCWGASSGRGAAGTGCW